MRARLTIEERRRRKREKCASTCPYPKTGKNREKARRKRKHRYAKDAGFRKHIGDLCKSWREKNHDYDMLRKTIAAINECGNEAVQARKNETRRKWFAKQPKKVVKAFRKRQAEASLAWYYRQKDDPELGELFRLIQKPITEFYTVEMKETARMQYKAIMDRRREERRRKRIDRLMEGCTEKQKARIRGRLVRKEGSYDEHR